MARPLSHEQPPDLRMPQVNDVGGRALAGALWSAVEVMGRQLLSIGVTLVLARILSPNDYGLLGMVATLTALLMVVSDLGLSGATIQRKELTAEQVDNLFWVNTAAGVLMWLACCLLAGPLASFYGHQELKGLATALGAAFVMAGVAVQPVALLKRQLRLKQLAGVELLSVVGAGSAAIALALAGCGCWALVGQTLLNQALRLLFALVISGYRPSSPVKTPGTAGLLNFGGLLAFNGLLIYCARNFDSVLIGKVWGTTELGFYNRGYFLMTVPSTLATGILAQAMVPSLSALQEDPVRFGAAYRRAVQLVAFIGCPASAGMAVIAPEAIRFLYGPVWGPVVPIVIWLSLAGISQPIYNTHGWLFTAVGAGKSYLVVSLLNAVVLAAGFSISVRYGVTAVAATYGLIMTFLLTVPTLYLAHRAAHMALLPTLRSLCPVLAATAFMAANAFLAGQLAEQLTADAVLIAACKVATGVACYAAASYLLLRGVLAQELESVRQQIRKSSLFRLSRPEPDGGRGHA